MLRLRPEGYLIALGFLGQPAQASLTLTNQGIDSVAYKVKTNSPASVKLANHVGVLEGKCSTEVLATLDADWPDAKECKLQVISAPFSDSQQADWNQACPQMLKVTRVLSVPEPPTLPTLRTSGKPAETRLLIADLLLKTSVLRQQVESLRKELATAKKKKTVVPLNPQTAIVPKHWMSPGLCAFLLGLALSLVIPLSWTVALLAAGSSQLRKWTEYRKELLFWAFKCVHLRCNSRTCRFP